MWSNDGMTIYLYTGNGAGKTTNSLGIAMRMIAHEKNVLMIQFLKWNKNTGEFDFEILANNFDISDLLDWGFNEKELDWAPEMEGLCDENEVPEVSETPINMLGDMWVLGDHRLRCGDSTNSTDVDELLNGQKIDFLPIGIFDTNEQAHDFVMVVEKKIREAIKSVQNSKFRLQCF